MDARNALLFSIVLVLFGGFLCVGNLVSGNYGLAFTADGGYWIMVLGVAIASVSLLADGSQFGDE